MSVFCQSHPNWSFNSKCLVRVLIFCCCSVAKSCLTLPLNRLWHARLPWPLLSPGVGSCSYPLSQRGYLTISSSATLFSFGLQSFPASGSFPVSQLFASGSQRIGASASAAVLPMSNKGWFLLGLTGLISLLSKGFSRVFSNTTIRKHKFFSALLNVKNFSIYIEHIFSPFY